MNTQIYIIQLKVIMNLLIDIWLKPKKMLLRGFSTTGKTRPLIISKMEEVIRNRVIKINSSRLLHELETFSWINGRPEALKGYNDDLVISLAIRLLGA